MINLNSYLHQFGLNHFKRIVYQNASQYKHCCILDSCQLNTGKYDGKYELLAAFGAEKIIQNLTDLDNYQNDWLFGILSYDLKNEFEDLTSSNTSIIETPNLLFFVPKIIIGIDKKNKATLIKGEISKDFWNPKNLDSSCQIEQSNQTTKKRDYIQNVKKIIDLIKQGEVYELNYCIANTYNYHKFSPINFQLNLINHSPVPMAAYFKNNTVHLCGASMERFLTKNDQTLISQPIKGTIKKSTDLQEDQKLIHELQNSIKERAENIMIVDLVRNDLNRICLTDSVKVTELCEIYSYLQVHQMISSIEGILKKDTPISDILHATFPMGSMTGAPKISAMKQIDRLEEFRRGWYSGSVGYISPNGDFDFNVVIRSLLCDTLKKQINYCAGGAITIDSNPEKEWDEIKLKTQAINEVLRNSTSYA